MKRIGNIGIIAAAVALVTITSATPGDTQQRRQPGELRCGWLHNPTPGNYWLTDRDGTWILATQGRSEVPGMDRLPDMSTGGWVETNGYYGHGCACIRMTTNARRQVVRIHSGRPVPLSQCRNDRTLPRP